MKNYTFNVSIFGNEVGTVDVEAKDLDEAQGKADNYVGERLSDAIPEFYIEYSCEPEDDSE